MLNKVLLDFTKHMIEGSKTGHNPNYYAKVLVGRVLAAFMPVRLAAWLAGPIAAIMLTLVRRKIVAYKTEGQVKAVQRAVFKQHKDPEVLRKAFVQLATIKG